MIKDLFLILMLLQSGIVFCCHDGLLAKNALLGMNQSFGPSCNGSLVAMKHNYFLSLSACFSPLGSLSDLHEAAKDGDLNKVKEAIGKGESLSQLGPDRNTPLHYAVMNNRPEIVRELLQEGVAYKKNNSKKWSAFDIASINRSKELISLFSVREAADRSMFAFLEALHQRCGASSAVNILKKDEKVVTILKTIFKALFLDK